MHTTLALAQAAGDHLQVLAQGAPAPNVPKEIGQGTGNAKTLLFQIGGLTLIAVGIGVFFLVRALKWSKLVQIVGGCAVGLGIIAMGVGLFSGNNKVGATLLSFTGFGS